MLEGGNDSIVWKCGVCIKNKGDETKKFFQLEQRLEKVIEMIGGVEFRLMQDIKEKISKEVQEQVSKLEERMINKMEKDEEEKVEREKRENNIIVINLPESTGKLNPIDKAKVATLEDFSKLSQRPGPYLIRFSMKNH